jgi:hypothetical protein
MADFTQWLISHGVSTQTLEMMVFVPILATLVSIVRYVLGLKTFGIYAPIILAIAFKFTGLAYGVVLTTIVILSTLLTYTALRRVRMHYITRIAINYVVLSICIVLGIVAFDSLSIGFNNFHAINPLAIVSIAALSDFFVKMYVKKSLAVTIRSSLETGLVAIIGWYLITSKELTSLMIKNLWIVPVLILVNLVLGQYRGLRFKDIFRFKSAVDDVSKSNK